MDHGRMSSVTSVRDADGMPSTRRISSARRPSRTRGRAAAAAVVVAAVSLSGCATSIPALVPFELPAPIGPSAVGVVTLEIPGGNRTMAELWYPAAPGDETTSAGEPWVDSETADVLEQQLTAALGIPESSAPDLSKVDGHARRGAAAAPIEDIPLVVFSPGLGASRAMATALAESLASDGVAVLAVDHPTDAASLVFPDGEVVRGDLPDRIDAAAGSGDRKRTERLSEDAVVARTDDVSAALDVLTGLSTQSGTDASALPPGIAGRIHTDHVVIMGHSLGGATALAAEADPRVAGVIDLDGTPWGPVVETGVSKPALIVLSDDTDPANDPQLKALLAASPDAELERIEGSRHLSFTDLIWLQPQLGDAGEEFLGSIDPTAFHTRLVSLVFDFVVRNAP
jgi:pimeloyl-ACP methyl ester carboxylesterase